MLVRQIVHAKAEVGVVTVQEGITLEDVSKILAEKRIGTVVVSPDGSKCVGILSERDIIRALSQKGAAAVTEKVENFMTSNVISCTLDATADHVLKIMTDMRFRHMPVIESGKLAGLITLGDVVKARLNEVSMEKDALEGMIMGY